MKRISAPMIVLALALGVLLLKVSFEYTGRWDPSRQAKSPLEMPGRNFEGYAIAGWKKQPTQNVVVVETRLSNISTNLGLHVVVRDEAGRERTISTRTSPSKEEIQFLDSLELGKTYELPTIIFEWETNNQHTF